MDDAVDLAYYGQVGTSDICPLYTKFVMYTKCTKINRKSFGHKISSVIRKFLSLISEAVICLVYCIFLS